jgi:hypothetical protein
LLVPSVLGLSLATFLSATQTDRQVRTLPSGRAINLEVTIGTVRVEGSTRSDTVIEVSRHVPNAEGLLRVPIEITEDDTTVRIRAVQIENGTDPSFRTDVTLRVPHDAVIQSIRVMEGRLVLNALHVTITADIRRGSIEASDLAGVVRLESGIGDVVANGCRLSPDGLLRFRAFNGDVRLTLAQRPADARILALALNGTISSDIPLQKKEAWGPRWGEATLGKGEPVISIDVITGRIEIKAPR